MKRIRYAIATYGKVARLHARALKTVENAELVAVWGLRGGIRDPGF